MMTGKWNGVNYEYPNGVVSPCRMEIKSITAYKMRATGEQRYFIDYHDGTTACRCATISQRLRKLISVAVSCSSPWAMRFKHTRKNA